MKILKSLVLFALLVGVMSSCYYKRDLMFRTETSLNEGEFTTALEKVKQGYRLKKGDVISFRLFTNKGEVVIDPNYDLAKLLGSSREGEGFTKQDGSATQLSYVVDNRGYLLLPMIGKIFVDSITHPQFDSLLAVKYSAYYQEPFITSQVSSRHIVILNGTQSKIIPLGQESMNLIEAIAALPEGLGPQSDIRHIRLIRGDLRNPSVMLIDLSTIEGMKKSDLRLLPDDIIYIEPGRSVVREAVKDFGPYLTILTTTLSLIVVLFR
ncbi:polysaccharide export outer membrane protein [Flexibacter flexilis DSM 6793]|uniref:Polysaccharide export outer membrane protein n=1 Tax=Flexibacter flexilis DSM 6793 TaxID=927664 RepID=A0A1I1FYE3_9BACT|nr:polysaccharide biosynthesis/export family protein [Flexibacter flexilis]SFC04374.1 polysaccharide export outer membrane protein [Flexibacter flexilis DSM 6793]